MVWVIRNVYTGKTHTITCEGLTVGRQKGLSLVCKNVLVSKTQAKVFLLDNTPYVLDNTSSNGTYINGRNIRYKGQVKLEKDVELGFAMFRTKGSSVPEFPGTEIKTPYYIYKVLNLPDFIEICDSDSEDVVFVEHKADESNNFKTSSTNINNNELLPLNSEVVDKNTSNAANILIDTLTPKENGEHSKNTPVNDQNFDSIKPKQNEVKTTILTPIESGECSKSTLPTPINVVNNEICNINSDSLKTKPKTCSINTVKNKAADNKLLIRCDTNSLSKNCDNKVKQISHEEKELRDLLDGLDDDERKKESKQTKKKGNRSTSTSSSNHSTRSTSHDSHKSRSRKDDAHRSSHKSKSKKHDREHHSSGKSRSKKKDEETQSRSKKTDEETQSRSKKKDEETQSRSKNKDEETQSRSKKKEEETQSRSKNKDEETQSRSKKKDEETRKNGEREKQSVVVLEKHDEPIRTDTAGKAQKSDKKKHDKSSGTTKRKNSKETTKQIETNNSTVGEKLSVASKNVEDEVATIYTGKWLTSKADDEFKDAKTVDQPVNTNKNKFATIKGPNVLIEVASSNLTTKINEDDGKCIIKQPIVKLVNMEKLGNKSKFATIKGPNVPIEVASSNLTTKINEDDGKCIIKQPIVKLVNMEKLGNTNKLASSKLATIKAQNVPIEVASGSLTTKHNKCIIKQPIVKLVNMENIKKTNKNKLTTIKAPNVPIEVASSSLTTKVNEDDGNCIIKQPIVKLVNMEELGNNESTLLEGIASKLEARKKVDVLIEGITKSTRPAAERKLSVRNFDLENAEKQDVLQVPDNVEANAENNNEDDVIILSDGEDIEFMRSQLYIKDEPVESDECQDYQVSVTNVNQDASTSSTNMVSSQQFLQIKKEVEAFDAYSDTFVAPPINLDETDYDYDDEFIRRLYQNDDEYIKATPTPSDFTSVDNDNIAIDYTAENNRVEEEDSHNSDQSLVIDAPPILESPAKRKRGRLCKNQSESDADDMPPIKKTYIAPPIIEPHIQEAPRKRRGRPSKSVEATLTNNEVPVKKRRVSTATKTTVEDASKAVKDQLVSERKQRLKELALREAADKEKSENQYRPKNPVHVKVSSGRGNFLLDSAQRDPRLNPANRAESCYSDVSKYESQHRFIQDFKEMIFDIIKWKVEWFQNADTMKPPQLTSRNLIQMCSSFACYDDYFDVLYPLLMFDFWNSICCDYRETKMASNSDIMAAITNVFVKSTHTELLCTGWLEPNVNLSNNHLKDRNLVSFTVKLKQGVRILFGVVGWTHKEPIKKTDRVDSVVLGFCKTCPTTKLTFSLIIENVKEQFEVGSRLLIRYFPNLPQYFRNYSMLKRLQHSSLIEYLLDPQPQDERTPQCNRQAFSMQRLNPSQMQAVSESVSLFLNDSPGIYLIEGPPGTGKSTVITSIIMEIILKCNVQKNQCILLLAPSNAAIDSLVTKISYEIRPKLDRKQKGLLKLVRVGHPDAVAQKITPFTLESLAEKNAMTVLLNQTPAVKKDHEALVTQVKLLTAKCQTSDDEALRKKCKEKQEELNKFFKTRFRVQYNDTVQDQQRKVLASANIICSTIGSCQKAFVSEMRDNIKFCIIDEASQASEIDTLIPIGLGASKLVLVGDPKQLPAVTTNQLSKTLLYGQSLFARIKNKLESTNYDPKLLDVQYRMNPEIAKYPNDAFYEGRIVNSREYKVQSGLEKLKPYMVFSYDWSSERTNKNQYHNDTELKCIVELLQVIIRTVSKGTKMSIGIVTPYGEQRHKINQQLSTLQFPSTISITCNTIDSFQGQEKDVILLSCVRLHSNCFLADENRLCVALTRAKHALYIVGNISLLSNCDTFSKLLQDAKDRNLYCNISCVPKAELWEHLIKKSSR